ncbi:OmpA family protein, partial [Bacteroides sp. OttesenSCG-928-J23]|nr:OmpA family protein [Bacteroides sp. OttesenSCG-928-J23]
KGYADSSTGSQQTNQRLSEQRAKAVVDALVGLHNISRDRFVKVEGMGGVDGFEKAYLNRMVLIEVAK